MKRIAKASPRRWARIAGAFCLLTFVTGTLSAAFVAGRFAATKRISAPFDTEPVEL